MTPEDIICRNLRTYLMIETAGDIVVITGFILYVKVRFVSKQSPEVCEINRTD